MAKYIREEVTENGETYSVKVYESGRKQYYKPGTTLLHRLNGPAVIYADGRAENWVDGYYKGGFTLPENHNEGCGECNESPNNEARNNREIFINVLKDASFKYKSDWKKVFYVVPTSEYWLEREMAGIPTVTGANILIFVDYAEVDRRNPGYLYVKAGDGVVSGIPMHYAIEFGKIYRDR